MMRAGKQTRDYKQVLITTPREIWRCFPWHSAASRADHPPDAPTAINAAAKAVRYTRTAPSETAESTAASPSTPLDRIFAMPSADLPSREELATLYFDQ